MNQSLSVVRRLLLAVLVLLTLATLQGSRFYAATAASVNIHHHHQTTLHPSDSESPPEPFLSLTQPVKPPVPDLSAVAAPFLFDENRPERTVLGDVSDKVLNQGVICNGGSSNCDATTEPSPDRTSSLPHPRGLKPVASNAFSAIRDFLRSAATTRERPPVTVVANPPSIGASSSSAIASASEASFVLVFHKFLELLHGEKRDVIIPSKDVDYNSNRINNYSDISVDSNNNIASVRKSGEERFKRELSTEVIFSSSSSSVSADSRRPAVEGGRNESYLLRRKSPSINVGAATVATTSAWTSTAIGGNNETELNQVSPAQVSASAGVGIGPGPGIGTSIDYNSTGSGSNSNASVLTGDTLDKPISPSHATPKPMETCKFSHFFVYIPSCYMGTMQMFATYVNISRAGSNVHNHWKITLGASKSSNIYSRPPLTRLNKIPTWLSLSESKRGSPIKLQLPP